MIPAPSREEWTLRGAVVHAARSMNAQGLNQGTSGNVSARWRTADFEGFLITPSGVAYERIGPADIVALDQSGESRDPDGPIASSEWRFHQAIYAAREDAAAIVHTHSLFATTLACQGRAIPAFHYMIAVAGGSDIRCAPYARFGSRELADAAVAAIAGRNACLLAQHGMIAIGGDLGDAMRVACEVETLARMYWQVLQIGTPPLLDDAEMALVVDRFAGYGPRRNRRPGPG